MNKILIVFILIFVSCTNEKPLEIEILNNEFLSYSKTTKKDTINRIRFSVKNNSEYIYFINGLKFGGYKLDGISKNGVTLKIYDSKNNEVEYFTQKQPSADNKDCILTFINDFDKYENRYLGYGNYRYNYFNKNNIEKNFIIYPNQEIFFEYPLTINKTIKNDGDRSKIVKLEKNSKYFSKILINSDSTNYKAYIPWDVLQTIKKNDIKIYHGIIESKNIIPIKILE